MTSEPPTDEAAAKARRDKFLSRLVVIGLLLLTLAYAIPTFMNGRH